MDVIRVDEAKSLVYFTAVGRDANEDPYQKHLYVIGLDGSKLRDLTPEKADHDIHVQGSEVLSTLYPSKNPRRDSSFSPTGRYFIDTFSRPDLPAKTVLRSISGDIVLKLEEADFSALSGGGFVSPEPFNVVSADGAFRLYGTLYRPSTFNAAKSYPIIDYVYPGPQIIVTPKSFSGALYSGAQALAELGFVVVNIDGRGTPFRSKSFHDLSYGKWAEGGNLDDHIAAIRQLSVRFPYLNLSRVGVTGHSGGGFASTRAILAYPDFYKVAVSSSGAHDLRSYLLLWGPMYQGPYTGDNYDDLFNARLASNLKGKLLLIHGEMDDNVHPAQTMQLVDALVKADKDFDLLIFPGEDHYLSGVRGYFQRKRWDYFVRNLLGREPPAGYSVKD